MSWHAQVKEPFATYQDAVGAVEVCLLLLNFEFFTSKKYFIVTSSVGRISLGLTVRCCHFPSFS